MLALEFPLAAVRSCPWPVSISNFTVGCGLIVATILQLVVLASTWGEGAVHTASKPAVCIVRFTVRTAPPTVSVPWGPMRGVAVIAEVRSNGSHHSGPASYLITSLI